MTRARAAARPQALVQVQRLGDLLLDGVERIERGHRLLEHHGDAVAADVAQHRLRRADQLLCRRSGCCCVADGAPRDRAEAAGSTAPSPICPSRISPTSASVSPLSRSNETPLHRLDGAAGHVRR